MIKLYNKENHGHSNLGWLDSYFHFSFADYYNPERMNFGTLRVINDDLINSGTGFGLHPHRDMEIVSYVIEGELTHGDNMGNKNTIQKGHVQYMSAGTGVFHSEHNYGKDIARLLQIWILPDKKNYKPQYGDYNFKWEDRINKMLHMVSPLNGNAPIKINQDTNIYASYLEKGKEIVIDIAKDRQAYLVLIEGHAKINALNVKTRDGLESKGEDLKILAEEHTHFLVIESAI